ncbi:MAG: ethanolamine ammonia-lyase reactivating factor EutA, partial [Chloroflexi bacterium]|nr:ethanolamine ammonia-lyase reactivating factor EutA [Chloroflexota bacterium]
MHDEPWAHAHDPDEERLAALTVVQNNPDADYYHHENIELTTVGIDIGSSTSHLMFSRIHLQRESRSHSSRYVVVERETLYRSPILLTPYTAENAINTPRLEAFINEAYREAGYATDDIDSGAVILTGEAVKRTNAEAIAGLFADAAGKFVCASAGNNLEAILAANGSGAVSLSRDPVQTVLNVDMGGGTTKFALVHDGRVVETAALNVGGRLVATDGSGRIVRIEPAAHTVAGRLGIALKLGAPLEERDRDRIAEAMAVCVMELVERAPRTELTKELLLTSDLASTEPVSALVFSGGVSEYVYETETRSFDDLAMPLAAAIRRRLAASGLPAPVQPAERIRATVIGASQFTVQLSGNTLSISDPGLLPYRNVPVLLSKLPEERDVEADEVRGLIAQALERLDITEGEDVVALAFDWEGLPRYAQLRKIADGIVAAVPRTLAGGGPLILV